jgi:BON domain-containing protein
MCVRQRILALHLIVVALGCQLGCLSGNERRLSQNVNFDAKISPPDDAAIRARIETTAAQQGLTDVHVRSDGGQVFLTGYVDDESQRQTAEQIASQTPGVTVVRNEIVVCKNPVNVNKRGGPRRCS